MQQEAGRAGALLTIDLKALRANYRFLQSRLGTALCGAAVKADAYGLGAIPVSKALVAEGCRHLFVAQLEEAISLRTHIAHDVAIYVMHGSPVGYEAEFIEYGCTPVLNSLEQISAWRILAKERSISLPAIIQIDTGMARMGLSQAELRTWLNDFSITEGIDLRYVMSHLACAEDQLDPMNQMQLSAFKNLCTQLRQQYPDAKASFSNSSGIFLGSEFHFDLARPGAALYGVAPVAGQESPMQSVVQLQGRIIQTREIPMGASVGYSKTWRATQPSRIATVSVGYADGWLRSLSNCGVAHISGIEVPMVGNVSMDTITLNVSHVDPQLLYPGALVDLICPDNTVDQVAKQAGTIGYEILTSLGPRYQRHYVDV
ncbi:alanine racemase [Undibacterium sp. Di24W]|uniref:alanine racemase n=1 Tax=Undibacterium sp. Di24W TaxID=3413033 RepID=UPI003BF3516C